MSVPVRAVAHGQVLDIVALVAPFGQRQVVKVVALGRHVQLRSPARKIFGEEAWLPVVVAALRDDLDISPLGLGHGGLDDVWNVQIHDFEARVWYA